MEGETKASWARGPDCVGRHWWYRAGSLWKDPQRLESVQASAFLYQMNVEYTTVELSDH